MAKSEETTWTWGSWDDDPMGASKPADPHEELDYPQLQEWKLVAAGIVQEENDRRPGYRRYHVWAARDP